MFAKINEDGAIEFAPKNFVTESGETIINFDQSIDDMTANGFSEIVDTTMPDDGQEYNCHYELVDGVITLVWEVAPPNEEIVDPDEYPDMQGGV